MLIVVMKIEHVGRLIDERGLYLHSDNAWNSVLFVAVIAVCNYALDQKMPAINGSAGGGEGGECPCVNAMHSNIAISSMFQGL
jgi:hypothetical protein